MMKFRNLIARLSLAVALLGTNSLMGANEVADDPSHVRVMTFNIRYNNPADGQDAWPHRTEMVSDIIREHADIAGLQEA